MSIAKDLKQQGIKVELDTERHLILDLNAFCEIEDRYDNIDNGMNELLKGSVKAVRFFLYAAMKHEDDSLTEKEVGKLVNLSNIDLIKDALLNAMDVSLPEPEPTKNE